MWRDNQYRLIKDVKSFTVNMQKRKLNISLVISNQAKKLIITFLRES